MADTTFPVTTARGSRHGVSFIQEVTFGVTPDTPEMIRAPHTDCGLELSKETYQSQTLRPDRQQELPRMGKNNVAGPLDFEFSPTTYDSLLEGALFGTWDADVLKLGTDLKSYTVERQFEDIGVYEVFRGNMVNSMSMAINTDGLVTGSFGLMGKSLEVPSASLDTTPTDSGTFTPFDSYTGVIKEGGTAIAVITSFDFSIENGVTPSFVIGSRDANTMTAGRVAVSGTISAYFADKTLLEKFINVTRTSIELQLGEDATIGTYTFDFPLVTLTSASNPTSGDGDVMLSIGFEATYDSTDDTTLSITRITV